jgi:hypothetical protein
VELEFVTKGILLHLFEQSCRSAIAVLMIWCPASQYDNVEHSKQTMYLYDCWAVATLVRDLLTRAQISWVSMAKWHSNQVNLALPLEVGQQYFPL